MTIASDLLQRHIQTLVADNAQWQTLIADDLLWELVYAPAIGHPARLSGRKEVCALDLDALDIGLPRGFGRD